MDSETEVAQLIPPRLNARYLLDTREHLVSAVEELLAKVATLGKDQPISSLREELKTLRIMLVDAQRAQR